MPNKIYNFSEFNDFYGFFKPLTPFGKMLKEKKLISEDIKFLDKEYSLINNFISIIRKDKILFDRIENHLREIPLLNFDNNRCEEVSTMLRRFAAI